jgi:hypothetical protein
MGGERSFKLSYELAKGKQVVKGTMTVDASSYARAKAWAEHQLEEHYPGDEGWVLLVLE